MTLFIFIIILIFAPIAQDSPNDNIILVTVIGDNGRPQPAVLVEFVSEDGSVKERCFTDNAASETAGQCTITGIPSPTKGGLIRGQMQVGSWGFRSVIWPGGELNLLIDVSEGLTFNHPPHGEMDATTVPSPTIPHTVTPTAETLVIIETTEPAEAITAVPSIELILVPEKEPTQHPTSPPEPDPITFKKSPSPLAIVLTTVFITLFVVGVVALLIHVSKKERGG